MREHRKKSLAKEEYPKYGIPLAQNAFIFSLDKMIEERCDEFDYYLEDNGFIIANREMIPIATNIYNYEVIAYR